MKVEIFQMQNEKKTLEATIVTLKKQQAEAIAKQ